MTIKTPSYIYKVTDYPEEEQELIEVPRPLENFYNEYSTYLARGKIGRAQALLNRLLTLDFPANKAEFRIYHAVFLLLSARLNHRLGNYLEAEQQYQEALTYANEKGFIVCQISACINLGLLQLHQKNYQKAEINFATVENLLRWANKQKLRPRMIVWISLKHIEILEYQARLFTLKRQFSWAKARITEIETTKVKAMTQYIQISFYTAKAFLSYHEGNFGQAMDYYGQALAIAYPLKAGQEIFKLELGLTEPLVAKYQIFNYDFHYIQLSEVIERLKTLAKENYYYSSLPAIVMLESSIKVKNLDYPGALKEINSLVEFLEIHGLAKNARIFDQIKDYKQVLDNQSKTDLLDVSLLKSQEANILNYLQSVAIAIQEE